MQHLTSSHLRAAMLAMAASFALAAPGAAQQFFSIENRTAGDRLVVIDALTGGVTAKADLGVDFTTANLTAAKGRFFVLGMVAGSPMLLEVDPASGTVRNSTSIPATRAEALATDSAGNLVLSRGTAGQRSNTIEDVASNGLGISSTTFPLSYDIDDLAIDSAGDLIGTDAFSTSTTSRLYRYDRASTTRSLIATVSRPRLLGIDFDSISGLWALDAGNFELVNYDTAGTEVLSVALPGSPDFMGLACLPARRFWAIEDRSTTDRLVKVDAWSGAVAVVADLGSNYTRMSLAETGARLFALLETSGVVDFVEIDPANGAILSTTRMPYSIAEGLASLPSGNLLACGGYGGSRSNVFDELTTSGVVVQSTVLGSSSDNDCVAVDSAGNVVAFDAFMRAGRRTGLYRVDRVAATRTSFGTSSRDYLVGATFDDCDRLFGVDVQQHQIVEIGPIVNPSGEVAHWDFDPSFNLVALAHTDSPIRPGTGEDLTLACGIDVPTPVGVAEGDLLQATGGSSIAVTVASPGGDLGGAAFAVLAEIYATGAPSPVVSVPGFEGIQVSVANPILTLTSGSLSAPDVSRSLTVPSGGPGGVTLVLQAVAVSSGAANGLFAWSDARLIQLQ